MAVVPLNHKIQGSGPHIVLLHPVGLDLTFLAPIAAELRLDFRVLSVDLRGHGRSLTAPAANGLADYADDVHALLVGLAFAPAAIVGFSFGGMVAQTLAIKYPQDVSALMPCACPSTLKPEGRNAALERALDAEREGMQAILEAALDRWFTPAFRSSGGDAAARQRLLSDDPRGWGAAWRAISGIDTARDLHNVRALTLCVAGELDKSSPPAIVKAIADAIPGSHFTVLPGAPHMLFIEQPQAMAKLIADFVAEVGKTRPQ